MDIINLQCIRESYAKVVYSHKVHEKAVEQNAKRGFYIKWANVILTSLTSGSLFSNIFTNHDTLFYLGIFFSTLTLAFTIYQLSFNYSENADKHRSTAKCLWYVKEKYINLMTDIVSNKLDPKAIIDQRDKLIDELNYIYIFAPQTDASIYKKAQNALKLNQESTFCDDEIDQFLPESLKMQNLSKT